MKGRKIGQAQHTLARGCRRHQVGTKIRGESEDVCETIKGRMELRTQVAAGDAIGKCGSRASSRMR